MRLKKFKASKSLLLKIFLLQQKNKLNLNIRLKQLDLPLLFFLWQSGYIVGFTCLKANYYTVFLKSQFKQFSIKFFESALSYKLLCKLNRAPITKTPLVLSDKGLLPAFSSNKNIGGFLLCDIF
jgi:hypothetical protein